jgi:tetratricopeptide (TPR) repeat protein
MTDDLYERYKEALRVGHVAVLRGSLEEALTAYRAAAEIAPSRALPHTSLGGALLRLGRLEEALVEYAVAVARAPHDEGALLGQAEALTAAGQRSEAARVLDHVSEIEEAAGRLPEAADTLRRALELDESPERARRQRGLRRETRLSAGDQAAEQLLARALRLRDEPAVRAADASKPVSTTAAALPAAAAAPAEPAAQIEYPATAFVPTTIEIAIVDEGTKWQLPAPAPVDGRTESGPRAAEIALYSTVESTRPAGGPADHEGASAMAVADVVVPEAEAQEIAAAIDAEVSEGGPVGAAEGLGTATAQPSESLDVSAAAKAGPGDLAAAVGVMAGPEDTVALPGPVGESDHQPTGDELLVAAEAADIAGDEKALRSLLVWTARAYAREGRFDAGLDATHRLLQRSPGDVDAHLVLVELYVARNWNSLAAEKLVLLGRLADLDGDVETRERLCAVASRAFPKNERLESLCA